MVYDFSGPESGPELFGARIRDPNGTAFRGPNRGPNRTTFPCPGLLAVNVSPGALWRPPFQSAHLCPPAILSGPEMEQRFGARIRARIEQLFEARTLGCACFSRGSLEAIVSICTFVSTSNLFGARMVYDFSVSESGTRMEQRFGARIRARIDQLFEARGSWLCMFL